MNDDDPAAAHLHFSYAKDAEIILGLGMMVAKGGFFSERVNAFIISPQLRKIIRCVCLEK